jgi:hypothetical protein
MTYMSFKKATDAFQIKGARIMLMHTSSGQEYFIVPGGKVTPEVARQIINRPDVAVSDDGLFPNNPQCWKIIS